MYKCETVSSITFQILECNKKSFCKKNMENLWFRSFSIGKTLKKIERIHSEK